MSTRIPVAIGDEIYRALAAGGNGYETEDFISEGLEILKDLRKDPECWPFIFGTSHSEASSLAGACNALERHLRNLLDGWSACTKAELSGGVINGAQVDTVIKDGINAALNYMLLMMYFGSPAGGRTANAEMWACAQKEEDENPNRPRIAKVRAARKRWQRDYLERHPLVKQTNQDSEPPLTEHYMWRYWNQHVH